MPAELAGQRPLLERAASGDREALALLCDTQVTGVYRYLLAWTGSPAEAADLTGQVFHSATGWLATTTGPEGEASAWLTAMSRDALARCQAAIGPGGAEVAAGDVVAAVTRLREPEREVAILRLLLGHSLDHTAHLSGYSHRAAMELQLAACLAIHEVTGGATPPGRAAPPGPPGAGATGALTGDDLPGRDGAAPPPEANPAPSAEEFERRLGLWEVDLTGSEPALAGALTAARALRRAAPEHVADPPSEFVRRLRWELVAGPGAVDGREQLPTGPAARARRSAGPSWVDRGVVGWLGRRPWVATAVATTGIVVVLTSQALGGSGQPTACEGPECAAPTTRAVAAGGRRNVGTPLTTEKESSTTSSTLAADPVVAPSSAVPRTSAARVPPSTRPPTTAPPTTVAPRPTTTTGPTTTATTAPAPT